VVLAEEVGFQEDLGKMSASFGENQLLEQVCKTVVIDKVGTNSKLSQLRFRVGCDAVTNCLETCLANSVVADIQEFQRAIFLEAFTNGSRSVDVTDVPVEVPVPEVVPEVPVEVAEVVPVPVEVPVPAALAVLVPVSSESSTGAPKEYEVTEVSLCR
jgi:hypothetical protein